VIRTQGAQATCKTLSLRVLLLDSTRKHPTPLWSHWTSRSHHIIARSASSIASSRVTPSRTYSDDDEWWRYKSLSTIDSDTWSALLVLMSPSLLLALQLLFTLLSTQHRVSLDPFLFFGISTHTSVDPSITFASFSLLVWVFCQSHSRSLGGETSWLGTSRLQCLCDARVVLWFLSLGKFSSNVNPLVLCSITSRLRPSALVFHITKWQLASIQDTCKDSSGTPPIIWFHLEYSCHVVSSFCVFVYTNRVSFRLFKQQPIVY
jgi:hypothetical protein